MTIINIQPETTQKIENFDTLQSHVGEQITVYNKTIGLTQTGTLHSYGGDSRSAYINWSENYRQTFSKAGLHGGLENIEITVKVSPTKLPESKETLIYVHRHTDPDLELPINTPFLRMPEEHGVWDSLIDGDHQLYDSEILSYEVIELPQPTREA